MSDANVRGVIFARKFFAKRGNHAEAHVSEIELAALLSVVFEQGQKAANVGLVNALEQVEAGIGDRLLANGPLSQDYADAVLSSIRIGLRGAGK